MILHEVVLWDWFAASNGEQKPTMRLNPSMVQSLKTIEGVPVITMGDGAVYELDPDDNEGFLTLLTHDDPNP